MRCQAWGGRHQPCPTVLAHGVQVQLDIREGHARTVGKVLAWLPEDLRGVAVCDAGCGTGSLALPLAARGADVAGFDISQAMARLPGLPQTSYRLWGCRNPQSAPQGCIRARACRHAAFPLRVVLPDILQQLRVPHSG